MDLGAEMEGAGEVRAALPLGQNACPVCGASAAQSTDPDNLDRAVCYCGHPRYHDDRVSGS